MSWTPSTVRPPLAIQLLHPIAHGRLLPLATVSKDNEINRMMLGLVEFPHGSAPITLSTRSNTRRNRRRHRPSSRWEPHPGTEDTMGNQSWEDSDVNGRTLFDFLRGSRSRGRSTHDPLVPSPRPDSVERPAKLVESRMSDAAVAWGRRRESRPGYPRRMPDVGGAA